ncbi:hypothetical protein F7725_017864 [Dissostichus mawsoni]|uniref:Uncharacterized protein n=1 Tax=Dissostichus mawsoni TaxID=36200 RepID=A0A7J5XRF7_DISMA|nr:hypothetical protein F7725_017864 [Dissostichus mawsoni]
MSRGLIRATLLVFESERAQQSGCSDGGGRGGGELRFGCVQSRQQSSTCGKKREDTVYGGVKVQNETKNKDSAGHRRFQHLACCLGILCVILLGASSESASTVIAPLILESDPNQLKKSQLYGQTTQNSA